MQTFDARQQDGPSPSYLQKAVRYSLVSVVNVLLGETLLSVAFYHWRWSARDATLFATGVATVPAYFLSRRWVWRRGGRSSLTAEVLPFFALSFLGLVLSVWGAGVAERFGGQLTQSRRSQTVLVMATTLGAFGVVWVARFVILDRVLFRASPGDDGGGDARI